MDSKPSVIPDQMEASLQAQLDLQLDLQLAESGARVSESTNQEQLSGIEVQQYLPTNLPPPEQHSATNVPSRGQGRPAFVDNAERWTQVVLRKLERSKRTGQACNRCKARKLRCDSQPGGCLHCYTVQQRCMVTDRTTGDTFERGECARLKAANSSLREQLTALQQENQRLEQENQALRTQLGSSIFHQLPSAPEFGDASQAMGLDFPGDVNDAAFPYHHAYGFENSH